MGLSEVLEVWRICCSVGASTRLEARGLGGFMILFIHKLSKSRLFRNKIGNIIRFRAKVVNMTTLIGPKWAHKQEKHIFATYFDGSRGHEHSDANLQRSEPRRLGGGRGRVNPPPCGLV